jgi:2,5-furandicarboxylate decarboxylase 1
MKQTKDLRSFLKNLDEKAPHEVVRTKREVDLKYEITAVQIKLDKIGKYPLLIFENVKNLKGEKSKFPVITNMFATRSRCAFAMDTTGRQVGLEYHRRCKNLLKPEVVNAKDAPVKQIVKKGNEASLLEFPIPLHHHMDIGHLIHSSVVTTLDSETGKIYDCAYQVLDVKKERPRKVCVEMSPATHNYLRYLDYDARNEEMPVIAWLGHHPAACLGSLTRVPIDVDEYSVMGGVMQQPLRVVPSETWGEKFLVPADAEIVIEGTVPPKVREVSGPHSDYSRYYMPQKLSLVMNITAITCRKDAYYHDINIGGRDLEIMGGIPIEGGIFQAVRSAVPSTLNVYLPPSGCCRHHAYIQIKKKLAGQGRDAIVAALPSDHRLKHVIVVDEDVDIFNEQEVLWAVATRAQLDRDLVLEKNMVSTPLDPSAYAVVAGTKTTYVSAKGGIDATKPVPPEPFEVMIKVPDEVMKKVKLTDYVEQEALEAIGYELEGEQ